METFSTAVTVSNKTVFLEKPGALQAASVVQAERWNFLGLWRVDAESQKANLRDSESSLLCIARTLQTRNCHEKHKDWHAPGHICCNPFLAKSLQQRVHVSHSFARLSSPTEWPKTLSISQIKDVYRCSARPWSKSNTFNNQYICTCIYIYFVYIHAVVFSIV